MKTKICTKCKKKKFIEEFCVNRAVKDGLNSRCKECVKQYNKQYYKNNPEKFKEHNKQYYKANKEKYNENAMKVYHKKKLTAKGQLEYLMATLVSRLLKGTIKSSPTLEETMDCTSQQILDHFQSLFLPGMTWANYGTKWETDHIIAKVHFHYSDITDPQFKKCWSLKNLQPLWKADNQRKGVK